MTVTLQRKAYLDYAKGIGILLVVLGHVVEFSAHTETTMLIRQLIYAFHMPLFFIISGMIIHLKVSRGLQDNFRRIEMGKIVQRLLLPYFTWSLIYLVPISMAAFIHAKGLPLERIYAIITFRGIAPIWFLAALFFAELIFWLSIDYLQTNRQRILLIISLVAIACLLSEWFNAYKDSMTILYKYPVVFISRQILACLFLLIGYEFAAWYKNTNITRKRGCFAVSMAIFLLAQLFSHNVVNMHTFDFYQISTFVLTGATGSVSLICFCDMLRNDISFLSDLGKKSFDIMMLHYPPIPSIKVFLYLWGGTSAAYVSFNGYRSISGKSFLAVVEDNDIK